MNKISKAYMTLLESYGTQGWWPLLDLGDIIYKPGDKHYGGYHPGDYSYPKTPNQRFEICVGAILTQNTSWLQVTKALNSLKHENLLSPKAILTVNTEKLAGVIRPAGYYNQKARKLKIFAEFFSKLGNQNPKREELLSLWGIGPETADSMLLYAFGTPTFVIDAYTRKIFLNLGLIGEGDKYNKIKELFEDNLKQDLATYQEYHALIVEHAKRYYTRSSDLSECPLYKRFRK